MDSEIVPATGWGIFLPWYDPLVAFFTRERIVKEHLLRVANLSDSQAVLDVGCGTGTLALALDDMNRGLVISAIDADSRALELASRKFSTRAIDLRRANATRLPFPDVSFDRVFCSLVMHHLAPEEKLKSACEMRRVLVDGGTAIIADFCLPSSSWAYLKFLPVRIIDGWHRTQCNLQGLLPSYFQDAGFANVQTQGVFETPLGTVRGHIATR